MTGRLGRCVGVGLCGWLLIACGDDSDGAKVPESPPVTVEMPGAGNGSAGASPTITAGTGGSGPMTTGDAGSAVGPDAGDGSVGDAGPIEQPPPTLIGDVELTVPSQTFRDALEVGMSTAIAGAEIRYTTDGTLPTASSELYAQPISLSETTQLRAQAFVDGVASGAVSTALYIARTFDRTSDLPIVIIDGYGTGQPSDKDVYVDAAVMVFEPIEGMASIAALPTFAARAGYHVRGQSSARQPQTPYRVELWDNANEDSDYAVLGMPADSDWALIAPYYDRALIRNPLVYELGRDMGLEAPRVRFAEVYVNYQPRALSEDDYLGVYWITETIKNARVRTNLEQLREEDIALPKISGGYIFKFDQAAAEEPTLECTGSEPLPGGFGMGMGMQGGGTCWRDLEVVDPEPLVPEQAAWLTDYIQTFHDVVHEDPIGDYEAFIDVASFVDYLIVNELTRNVDAYVRSAYFHKERDGKLMAGPLWDYNFSLAVGGQGSIDPMGGWQFEGSRNVADWYPRLTADSAFMDKVKARWSQLRMDLLSDAAMAQRIDALVAPLTAAAQRDLERWPVEGILMPGAFVRGPSAPTWDGQVQALREFVVARSAWMDEQLR